jgi:hypothetical protein
MIAETIAKPDAGASSKRKPAEKWMGLLLKDKGGTGCSVIARFLAELHEARGTGAYIVDGDGTTASLSSHFGLPREHEEAAKSNSENPVHTFALHGSERDRDTLATLLERPEGRVLVDLPATSLTVVRRIENEYAWTKMFAEYGWRPTIIVSITPFKTSVFDLEDTMALFGDRADYVAFLNMGLADDDRTNFKIWDNGNIRKQFLKLGGVEIVFPNLKKGILAELEVSPELTFKAGKTSSRLTIMDRSRLAKWTADGEAAIAPAGARLGF